MSWRISVSQGGLPGASIIAHRIGWAAHAGRLGEMMAPVTKRWSTGLVEIVACRRPLIGAGRSTTPALRLRAAMRRSRRVGTICLLSSWSSPTRKAGWPRRLRSAAPTRLHGETRLRRTLRRREGTLPRLTAPPSPGAEHGEGFLGQDPDALSGGGGGPTTSCGGRSHGQSIARALRGGQEGGPVAQGGLPGRPSRTRQRARVWPWRWAPVPETLRRGPGHVASTE
jgi:hypothetical protein